MERVRGEQGEQETGVYRVVANITEGEAIQSARERFVGMAGDAGMAPMECELILHPGLAIPENRVPKVRQAVWMGAPRARIELKEVELRPDRTGTVSAWMPVEVLKRRHVPSFDPDGFKKRVERATGQHGGPVVESETASPAVLLAQSADGTTVDPEDNNVLRKAARAASPVPGHEYASVAGVRLEKL